MMTLSTACRCEVTPPSPAGVACRCYHSINTCSRNQRRWAWNVFFQTAWEAEDGILLRDRLQEDSLQERERTTDRERLRWHPEMGKRTFKIGIFLTLLSFFAIKLDSKCDLNPISTPGICPIHFIFFSSITFTLGGLTPENCTWGHSPRRHVCCHLVTMATPMNLPDTPRPQSSPLTKQSMVMVVIMAWWQWHINVSGVRQSKKKYLFIKANIRRSALQCQFSSPPRSLSPPPRPLSGEQSLGAQ